MSSLISAVFGFIALVALFASGVLLLALRVVHVAEAAVPAPAHTALRP